MENEFGKGTGNQTESGGKATYCYATYNINHLNKKLCSFKNMLALKLRSKTQCIKHMKKI